MSARRFGIIKGMPKPKTVEDWYKIYLKNRTYLYDIKRLDLTMVKYGPGNSGSRHFHYFKVPPIRWWNPDITIHEKKIERGEPSLIIEKVDGSKIEIDLKNMRADQIERVLASSGSLPAQ